LLSQQRLPLHLWVAAAVAAVPVIIQSRSLLSNNEEILVSFVDHVAYHGLQLNTFIAVQTMKFVTTTCSSTNLLSLSENKSSFV
jgi:hypothetical protein